ncbi:MAG: glycosyltransferase family 2 protein [Chthoniobacterales bacterium]
MTARSLSVVLPAFNEAENLAGTIADAVSTLDQIGIEFEIVTVDDGSSDATPALCAQLAAQDRRIGCVRHARNRGYGAALRTGFEAARHELVFFTDADGQFRFRDLRPFLAQIEGREMVIGYRAARKDPPLRTVNSAIGNWLARRLLQVRVRDINCAYKLFRRERLDALPLSSDGAMINTELLALAARADWRFCELPVSHYPRAFGTPTGAKLHVIAHTLREYFRVRRRVNAFAATQKC